jgi:hypothetical protein
MVRCIRLPRKNPASRGSPVKETGEGSLEREEERSLERKGAWRGKERRTEPGEETGEGSLERKEERSLERKGKRNLEERKGEGKGAWRGEEPGEERRLENVAWRGAETGAGKGGTYLWFAGVAMGMR